MEQKSYDKIIEKLDQSAVLREKIAKKESELRFALKYKGGLWTEEKFWLGGIPKRKLGNEFAQYVKMYREAFGHRPSWIVDSKMQDLDSFYGQMKIQWRKNK